MRIFILVILALLLTGCSINFGFVENKVYNEDSLKNYTATSEDMINNKYITRSEAIDIAYDVIINGFGVQVDKDSLVEYISLYEENSKFFWDIFLENKDMKSYNNVRVSCDNGDIIAASSYTYTYDINYSKNTDTLTMEECISIIKPLVDFLEINIDEYEVNTIDKYDSIIVELIKNSDVSYGFYINKYNKILVSYYKGE